MSLGPVDGGAASSSRLLTQKQVTQQIMPHWLPHVQSSLAPPSDRCDALRRLHLKQVFAAAPDVEVGHPRWRPSEWHRVPSGRIDLVLTQWAQEKVDILPVVVSKSGRIHGELLRLLFILRPRA